MPGDCIEMSVQSSHTGLQVDQTLLTFRCQLGKKATVTRVLRNSTDDKIFFKVMTTAPTPYLVRPSKSIIDPQSVKELQFITCPQQTSSSHSEDPKDKFVVSWVSLPLFVSEVSAEAFDVNLNISLLHLVFQTMLILPSADRQAHPGDQKQTPEQIVTPDAKRVKPQVL